MIDNNLKYCRKELNMTQTEFGNLFGVLKGTVSNWENGYSFMPLEKLISFSNQYGYSLDFICNLSFDHEKSHYPKITDKIKIGKALHNLRKSLQLSQYEFSKKCNISQSTYSHYEIGYQLITTLNLYSICKMYHVSMDSLLNDDNKIFKSKKIMMNKNLLF